MTTAAIVTTIIMSLVFIGGLCFCFTRIGKGGKWED
jgi:cbb3-type cytochrome oxidase subunit 3